MKKCYFLVILVILFIFVSCKTDVEHSVLHEKILLKTDKNNSSEVKIILEGKDGNCVDGAFVAIKSDKNDYSILEYNSDLRCYYENFEFGSLENINFVIDSVLLERKKEVMVPHFLLEKKPVLTVFSDSEGNSVLQGKSINSESEIQIAWDYPVENCLYKVSISSSLETMYKTSTKSQTVFVPKNVLQSGKFYYLKIEVQKSSGDILFEKDNYYSVSITETENIQFTTLQ